MRSAGQSHRDRVRLVLGLRPNTEKLVLFLFPTWQLTLSVTPAPGDLTPSLASVNNKHAFGTQIYMQVKHLYTENGNKHILKKINKAPETHTHTHTCVSEDMATLRLLSLRSVPLIL